MLWPILSEWKQPCEILNDFIFATLISDHNHILDWDMMIAYANRILTKMALSIYVWLYVYLCECVKIAANATQNRQKNPWENAKQLHFFCMCVCVCKKCK